MQLLIFYYDESNFEVIYVFKTDTLKISVY